MFRSASSLPELRRPAKHMGAEQQQLGAEFHRTGLPDRSLRDQDQHIRDVSRGCDYFDQAAQ